MDCNIIKDLIPLYIDGCCSSQSQDLVREHIAICDSCRKTLEAMEAPCEMSPAPEAPAVLSRLSDWKASVLQSVLLFISFAVITIGVALEAKSPYASFVNGFWALNLVIPATGFMLSLANWYFVKVYKSRKNFSNSSLLATLCITLCAYIWSAFHYEMNLFDLFAQTGFAEILEVLHALLRLNGIGALLTIVLCALSKILSNRYAKMLGKE